MPREPKSRKESASVSSQLISWVTLALLGLLSSTALAQPDTAEAKYAFQQGDYSKALTLYTQLNQSNPTPQLLYNQAVCHYKLRHWRDAERLFQQLYQDDPSHEKAQLNLALAQAKQAKYQQALATLDWLSLAAESEQIAAIAYKNYKLITAQLPNQSSTPAPKPKEGSQWRFHTAFSYGSDDNVYSIVEESSTTISDQFWEGSLFAAWNSNGDYLKRWTLEGSYYTSNYQEASDYDVDVLALGVTKHFALSQNQQLAMKLWADETQINGEGYLRSYLFQLSAGYKLSAKARLRYGARIKQSDELNESYHSMAGVSTRLFTNITQRLGEHSFRLGYRYDKDALNNGGGETTDSGDTTFICYSAKRHTLRGWWDYRSSHWRSRVYANYRASDYDEANRYSDDTSLIRSDRKSQFGLQLTYPLKPSLELELDWQHTRNHSSIDSYDYQQNLITLTLSWQN